MRYVSGKSFPKLGQYVKIVGTDSWMDNHRVKVIGYYGHLNSCVIVGIEPGNLMRDGFPKGTEAIVFTASCLEDI